MGPRLKLGLGLLGVTLLAFVAPLAERFLGRQRLRFNYLCSPMSDARYAELASKPGWSQARLQVAPGIRLRGLLRKPTNVGAPWVLFYPGNDESQLTMGQSFLSRLASDRDWGLAVFAYRGYDSSDGTPDVATLAVDAPAILDRFCVAQGVQPSNVHLIGFSIGGYFASHAARGANDARRSAATLTLMASVDDIVMVRKSPWQKLSPGDDYQTRPILTGVLGPVLVLQGTADDALAGPGQGRAIAAALGDRATYQELPGVGHEALLENDIALAKVRDFVGENSIRPR